ARGYTDEQLLARFKELAGLHERLRGLVGVDAHVLDGRGRLTRGRGRSEHRRRQQQDDGHGDSRFHRLLPFASSTSTVHAFAFEWSRNPPENGRTASSIGEDRTMVGV